MIEMRWRVNPDGEKELQYRFKYDPDPVNNGFYHKILIWSDWKTVEEYHDI